MTNSASGTALNEFTMPMPDVRARSSHRTIEALLLPYREFVESEAAVRAMYPWAERFVMGMPLPVWQRDLVWTDEQKIRFVTSVWSGLDLGSYLVNELEWGIISDHSGGITTKPFTDCILDGQQRLSAIEDYVACRIAVPDQNGVPRYFSDLPRVELRRFKNSMFARSTVSSEDEQFLRKIYDLRAFGGVQHQEHERASPRPRG